MFPRNHGHPVLQSAFKYQKKVVPRAILTGFGKQNPILKSKEVGRTEGKFYDFFSLDFGQKYYLNIEIDIFNYFLRYCNYYLFHQKF